MTGTKRPVLPDDDVFVIPRVPTEPAPKLTPDPRYYIHRVVGEVASRSDDERMNDLLSRLRVLCQHIGFDLKTVARGVDNSRHVWTSARVRSGTALAVIAAHPGIKRRDLCDRLFSHTYGTPGSIRNAMNKTNQYVYRLRHLRLISVDEDFGIRQIPEDERYTTPEEQRKAMKIERTLDDVADAVVEEKIRLATEDYDRRKREGKLTLHELELEREGRISRGERE